MTMNVRIAKLTIVVCLPSLLAAQEFTHVAQQHELGARVHPYRFVDLGTLGGSRIYINPASDLGSPNQVNAFSVAVGGAYLPIPHAGPCFGPDISEPFTVIHAFQSKNGDMVDLGSLGGAEHCSAATSINNRGLIAGNSENDANELRAVIWEDGQIRISAHSVEA